MKKKFIFLFSFFITLNLFSQQLIKNNIFGFATSNTFTFFDVNSQDFQQKVQNISPQNLRFPGGAVGNFYHYNKPAYGLDIREIDSLINGKFPKRARGLISYSRKINHKENYIKNFISLAKQNNADVVLVANILTANDDDIINMIREMLANNINVLGVELGSELSNKSYFDKGYEIDDYILAAKKTSNNIKSLFPEIKTAIVAAPLVKDKTHRHTIWNKRLSKENFYDAIIVHSYAKVVKGRDQYGQMIYEENEGSKDVSFDVYKNRLDEFFNNTYPQEINTYNSVFSNKPIWITEWNLQYSKKTGNTLFQALFVANYFLDILSKEVFKKIEITTFHNLAGRDFGGSIFQKKDNKTFVQSTFYPIKMLSSIFGSDSLIIHSIETKNNLKKYTISNKNNVVMSGYINWSEKPQNILLEENQDVFKEEFYGDRLYSLNSSIGEIHYNSNQIKSNGSITLKPYSFTLIRKK